jgi:hypothetical protein
MNAAAHNRFRAATHAAGSSGASTIAPRQSNRLPVSNNGSIFLESIVCRPTELSPTLRLHLAGPANYRWDWALRINQFDYLRGSYPAQASLAEQYVGLPFEA